MRNIIDINSDWLPATVPDVLPQGQKMYKRILPLNKEAEYVYYLEFISSVPNVELFLNEEKIDVHHGRYTIFRFDVTEQIVNGDNELDVLCDSDHPMLLANLIVVEKTHFSLDHFGDNGLSVRVTDASSQKASVHICASVTGSTENVMISYTVLTASGMMLANKSVPASHPEYECKLTKPSLWRGVTSPALYIAVASLAVNGSVTDQIVLPFGLTKVTASDHSDLLLNGTCIPQKDLTTSFDADPFVYDDADEDGTMLCCDLRTLCEEASDEADCKNQLTEYVLQHSYHPSILCWKLPKQWETLSSHVQELDPSRPVIVAD